MPSGMRCGVGRGVPPSPSRLGELGERGELRQQGQAWSSRLNRILAYFEGHRTLFLHMLMF